MSDIPKSKLRLWRECRGLSAADAGTLIGVSAVQWNRMENGRRAVAHKNVLKIEAITGISRHELRDDIFGKRPTVAA